MSRVKTPEMFTAYDHWFDAAEKKYSLPLGLLKAIAWVESRYDEKADAGTNAGKGLMQFIPSTAREYGIDPFRPEESILAAGAYMRKTLDAFGNDIEKAVQAYNMGLAGARKFYRGEKVKGDPAYSGKVMRALVRINGQRAITAPSEIRKIDSATVPKKPTASPPSPSITDFNAYAFNEITPAEERIFASAGSIGPRTPSWSSDTNEFDLMTQINKMFDEITVGNAEADHGGLAEIDKVLGIENHVV